jgi:uncharacterized flavoprotein (TIGR03862 family)
LIAVVGAGPAGLMAAEVLAKSGAAVTVFERMPSVGRKFLLAGRGGLNLTHGEPLARLLTRYGPAAPRLAAAIRAFPPAAVRAWCENLGQPTFVGSSGRVFPAALKASPLLRAWLRRLSGLSVAFRLRHRWIAWEPGGLQLAGPDGVVKVRPDATVLALGGASWPRLGSDGAWLDTLSGAGIAVAPLKPANCGFVAAWSDTFRDRFEGQPLKRIVLSFAGHAVPGEAVITRRGLEGGAVYALSAALRDAIANAGEAILVIDLKPDLATAELARRLGTPRGRQSLSTVLRKAARLAPPAIGLLRESAGLAAMLPAELAARIKAVPVRLVATTGLERAISTAGGIALDEINDNFMLRRRPGVFVAGEMLDWEAPTGGYLLQAAFATGAAAGRGALAFVAAGAPRPAVAVPK